MVRSMSREKTNQISLDNFWPYQVVVLADKISRNTHRVVKEKAALNLSQWRVLAAVADKPGRSAAEVTSVTPMDKTIVSRAVASLIETGLIKKSQISNDKRRLSLTITETGLRIYEDISDELNRTLIHTPNENVIPSDFVKTLKTYSAYLERIERLGKTSD